MRLDQEHLYPYQQRAVEHILSNNGSMLWLDIGLGKTIVSLTAIEHLLDSYKVSAALVVAPVKVIEAVWAQEAENWGHTNRLTFSLVRGTPAQRLKSLQARADVYLINYEQLEWLCGKPNKKKKTPGGVLHEHWLANDIPLPFDMVVFDEVSKMKTATAKRCKAFCSVLPHFTYRVGLTGTPATNGVIDLHGQYLIVDGGHRLGPNITGFRSRWFLQDMYSMKWSPRRGATEEIQQRIADITIEMKSSDYLELPPRIDQDWRMELPEAVQKQYKEFEKEFFIELDGAEVEAFSAGAKSMKCRQLANGAVYTDEDRTSWSVLHDSKLEALEEIIEELNGKPLLVCYQFIHDKERILRKFPEAVFLDAKNVAQKVDAWNQGEIKLLVGHPASMGHGLNLQYGGNHLVWFGVPWSLELYDQAIGRLLRNGQKGETVVNHRLIAKGTVEEAILTALESKDKTQAALREAVKQYRLERGR